MSDITIYENLANAIILQAVKDYRMALKSLKVNSRNRTVQTDNDMLPHFSCNVYGIPNVIFARIADNKFGIP